MLKIKDDVDLKVLEKFGFKLEKYVYAHYCTEIWPISRTIEIRCAGPVAP